MLYIITGNKVSQTKNNNAKVFIKDSLKIDGLLEEIIKLANKRNQEV